MALLNITSKDRALLDMTKNVRKWSSGYFDKLAIQADTDDARNEFENRAIAAYHYEESRAGIL